MNKIFLEKTKQLNLSGLFITQSQFRKKQRERFLMLNKRRQEFCFKTFQIEKQNQNFKFNKLKRIQISYDQIKSKYDENKLIKLQDLDSQIIELKQNIIQSVNECNLFAKEKILYLQKNFKNFKKNFLKRRNSFYCSQSGNSNKLLNTDTLQIQKEIRNNINNIVGQDKKFQMSVNQKIKKIEQIEQQKNSLKLIKKNDKTTIKIDKKINIVFNTERKNNKFTNFESSKNSISYRQHPQLLHQKQQISNFNDNTKKIDQDYSRKMKLSKSMQNVKQSVKNQIKQYLYLLLKRKH